MIFERSLKHKLVLFLLICLPMSCATSKTMTVGATASLLEDVAKSAYRQSDLRLIREGMPAYLMLIDGMVEAVPDNKNLLISAAQAYASFASAFVQDEDREYADLLYVKAKNYALSALNQIGFKNPAAIEFDNFEKTLHTLDKKDVPYLFWAASCWGSWISLNQRSMEAMAELPRVELMMKRVLELEEEFYYGGAHIFMGVLEASRPKIAGGDLNKAQNHFLKAIELGGGKFLMSRIYYADYYARKAFDKKLFISILQEVLDTPADIEPDLTLLNTVAHTRAQKLLNDVDEYF
ncbi:MAG: TRAP transporter TatT component family protein [Desulfobacterales bacterium]|nr:MAG: TRAP transporter TatT component family protein [Desulfobacterales bacterium]